MSKILDIIGTSLNSFRIGTRLVSGIKSLIFDNGFTATINANPTANRVVNLPDASGTIALSSDIPEAIATSTGTSDAGKTVITSSDGILHPSLTGIGKRIVFSTTAPTTNLADTFWREIDSNGFSLENFFWVWDSENSRWLSETVSENVTLSNSDSFLATPKSRQIILRSFSYRIYPTNGQVNQIVGTNIATINQFVTRYGNVTGLDRTFSNEVYIRTQFNGANRTSFSAINLVFQIIRS
jgi:hypothetical protein